MKQEKLNKMANSMVRIYEKAIKESEKWEEEDMVQMFKDDANDYLRISKLIKKGSLSAAAHAIADLDTAARDEIANYVYDAVMEYYR